MIKLGNPPTPTHMESLISEGYLKIAQSDSKIKEDAFKIKTIIEKNKQLKKYNIKFLSYKQIKEWDGFCLRLHTEVGVVTKYFSNDKKYKHKIKVDICKTIDTILNSVIFGCRND